MGQNLIIHLDQFQGSLGRVHVDCGNGCHGVAVIQHLLTGHAVFQNVAHAAVATRQVRQISRSNHGFHASQFLSF